MRGTESDVERNRSVLKLVKLSVSSRVRFLEGFDAGAIEGLAMAVELDLESRSPRDLDALFLACASPISYQSLFIFAGSARARNLPGGVRLRQCATSSAATFGCRY